LISFHLLVDLTICKKAYCLKKISVKESNLAESFKQYCKSKLSFYTNKMPEIGFTPLLITLESNCSVVFFKNDTYVSTYASLCRLAFLMLYNVLATAMSLGSSLV